MGNLESLVHLWTAGRKQRVPRVTQRTCKVHRQMVDSNPGLSCCEEAANHQTTVLPQLNNIEIRVKYTTSYYDYCNIVEVVSQY